MARKDALLRLQATLEAKRDAIRRIIADDLMLSEVSSETGDEGDAAYDGNQHELHTQLAAIESKELNLIEQAIASIQTGSYGACKTCGSKIPVARLKALPYSILCIDCQRDQESGIRRGSSYEANWASVSEYEESFAERNLSMSDLESEE